MLVFSLGQRFRKYSIVPLRRKDGGNSCGLGLSLNWNQNPAYAFIDYRTLDSYPNITLSFLICELGIIRACSPDEVRYLIHVECLIDGRCLYKYVMCKIHIMVCKIIVL